MIKKKIKVLIVGAGIAGRELSEELRKYLKRHYEIVGFIDDDQKKSNKKIDGVKVLGTSSNLSSIVREQNIEEVFIAIPSAKGEVIRNIINKCLKEKVKFKVIPRILEIVQGKVKLNQMREVQVEDLLGRAIIKSEQSIFYQNFQGKRIMVTGAAGSIGSEICRQLMEFKPKQLIAFDWWENGIFDLEMELSKKRSKLEIVIGNIQDYTKVKKAIQTFKPDIIFHAAAFKHVPLMQKNPEEAIKNNVFGTLNVAKAAFEEGVEKFVYISTDKAANPINVMGATKLIGEMIVADLNKKSISLNKKTRFSAVRFGNVLGSHGSVVPIFRKQIMHGGPLTVTDKEMRRFFMTIPEAVQLVLHASTLGKGGEIFILDMGEQVSIYELAKLMIGLSGFIPEDEIKIVFTGTRSGEKISEILSSDREMLESTENEKIFIVKSNPSDNIHKILLNLRKCVNSQNIKYLLNILKKIAPNLEVGN